MYHLSVCFFIVLSFVYYFCCLFCSVGLLFCWVHIICPCMNVFFISPSLYQHMCVLSQGREEHPDPHEMVECELCNTLTLQFNNHMKRHHPGCGQSAGRRGYRSNGAYVDGWFGGECGSGSPYYLLCSACREKYLASNLGVMNSKQDRWWWGNYERVVGIYLLYIAT